MPPPEAQGHVSGSSEAQHHTTHVTTLPGAEPLSRRQGPMCQGAAMPARAFCPPVGHPLVGAGGAAASGRRPEPHRGVGGHTHGTCQACLPHHSLSVASSRRARRRSSPMTTSGHTSAWGTTRYREPPGGPRGGCFLSLKSRASQTSSYLVLIKHQKAGR